MVKGLESREVEGGYPEPTEAAAFFARQMNRPVLNRGGDTGVRRPDELAPLWHLLLEGMRRGEGLSAYGGVTSTLNVEPHIVQTIAPDKQQRRGVDSRPNQDRVRSAYRPT